MGFVWRTFMKDCFWKTSVAPALSRGHDCYYMEDKSATAGVVAPVSLTPAELYECKLQCFGVTQMLSSDPDYWQDSPGLLDVFCENACIDMKWEWFLDDGTMWSATNRMKTT